MRPDRHQWTQHEMPGGLTLERRNSDDGYSVARGYREVDGERLVGRWYVWLADGLLSHTLRPAGYETEDEAYAAVVADRAKREENDG